MSLIGWNSARRVAVAAFFACSSVQGWPRSAASVWTARTGVAATPPAPMPRAPRRRPQACGTTRQTAEMSSS
jgi:hypothetical protein